MGDQQIGTGPWATSRNWIRYRRLAVQGVQSPCNEHQSRKGPSSFGKVNAFDMALHSLISNKRADRAEVKAEYVINRGVPGHINTTRSLLLYVQLFKYSVNGPLYLPSGSRVEQAMATGYAVKYGKTRDAACQQYMETCK